MVTDYGRGAPVTQPEVDRIAAAVDLRVHIVEDLSVPALLTFPFGAGGGLHFRLGLQAQLPIGVRRYITLHEAQHVRAEDISRDGPVIMHHVDPLPSCEPASDLFALVGMIDPAHLDHGSGWVEQQIRELVPIEDRGWQQYRCEDLAPRLIRLRRFLKE